MRTIISILILSLFVSFVSAQTQTFFYPANSASHISVEGEFLASENDTLFFYGYTCVAGSVEENQKLAYQRCVDVMYEYHKRGIKAVMIAMVEGETTKFGSAEKNRRVDVICKRKGVQKAYAKYKVSLKDTIVCDTVEAEKSVNPVRTLLNVSPIKDFKLPVTKVSYLPKAKTCPCDAYVLYTQDAHKTFKHSKDAWLENTAEDTQYQMAIDWREWQAWKQKTKACYKSYNQHQQKTKTRPVKRARVRLKPTKGKSGRGLAKIFPFINC